MSEPGAVSKEMLVSGTRQFEPQSFETQESVQARPSYAQNSFCVWEQLARQLELPWLERAFIDQGHYEVCVAAAFAQAIFATALQTTPSVRTSVFNMPCPWIMYQRVCQMECELTRRCKCEKDVDCSGLCDPKCGTTIVHLMDSLPSRMWTSANLQYSYKVDATQEIPVTYGCHEQILDCLKRNIPVVMNLYLFPNQSSFFDSHDLLVSGTGYAQYGQKYVRQNDNSDMSLVAKRPNTMIAFDTFHNTLRDPTFGIASNHLELPIRQGARIERGHCVLISGYFEKDGTQYVRCRNSFGCRWGFRGDFSMRLDSIDSEQVHKLVWIHPSHVSIKVFEPFSK